MKMKFVVGLAVSALSLSAFAQGSVENQAIIEVVNDPAPAASAKDLSQANSQAQTVTTTTTLQPIVQNQPVITQQQPTIYIQKQATTVVEDTPLTESNADKLRKQRVDLEQQTESKIVEKLEEARMKAEQERASKLLIGLDEKKVEEKKEEVIAAPVVVAPVQAVQVVEPVVVQEVKVEEQQPAVEVKSELAKLAILEKVREDKYYVTLETGFINYGADNIETGIGFGSNFGMIFDEKYIVEANFLYSRADIESMTRPVLYNYNAVYPTIINMDQYNFGGTFKWRILDSRFSPYIGGSLSYTYRDYSDEQSFDYKLSASSWAVDMGLLAGMDIKLSKHFSIGSEFKYLFNIAYDVSSNGLQQSKMVYPDFYAEPVEELGYYMFSLSARYIF